MKNSIKYIITRVISALLVAFSFWFLDTYVVNALQNLGALSNLTIDEHGQFYNNLSGSSSTSIGYGVSKVGEDDLAYYNAFPTNLSSGYYTKGGYGGSLVQCGMSFAANNYYSVSYYFLSDAGAYYYHPFYTQLASSRSLAIGTTNSISFPTFNYETVSNDIQRMLVEGLGYLSSYTVVFKAPTSGTCFLSAYSSNPTGPLDGLGFVGYTYESLGSSAPTTAEIQNALSSSFNSISNKIESSINSVNSNINSGINSVNSNIDSMKDKQDETNNKLDEAHETSKGIWGSIKELLTGIPKWFSNLANSIGEFFDNLKNAIGGFFENMLNGINELFFGKEETECVTKSNLFIGYDKSNIMPDADGWITLNLSSSSMKNYEYYSTAISSLDSDKAYSVFIEIADGYSISGTTQLGLVYSDGSQPSQLGYATVPIKYDSSTQKIIANGISSKDNVFYFKQKPNTYSSIPNIPNFISAWIRLNAGASIKLKYRILVTDDPSITLDNYEYFNTKEECSVTGSTGGLFGILGNFLSSIGNWFNNLFSIFEDTDVSGSTSDGQGFFEGFENNNYGISDIVSMPLVYIGKITTSTCTPLVLPLPFVEKNATLPCMNQLYREHFGSFLTLYQTITFGLIAYWVCINIFAMVRNFKNPDNDRIEVMDL